MRTRRVQLNGNTISESKQLADEQFLRRVARLYYEDGHSQEEIAVQVYCSRQTVGKALQKARDKGIVRITLVPEQRSGYLHNLARVLRGRLQLEDIELVTGHNVEDLPEEHIAFDIRDDIAAKAAEYLDQLLTAAGDILAVSGGRNFMSSVVSHLKPDHPLPKLTVVPTMGFVQPYTNFGDANLIAHDIAEAYGAVHTWLPVPAIVETQEQCEQARALPLVRKVLDIVEQANVFMLGIWPTPHRKDLVSRGILSQKQLNAVAAHNPATDINHWAFDASGTCINEQLTPPPYYLTGFEIPRLKEKIHNGAKVILVAGAGPSYVKAIKAALNAGIVNILITDHITAQHLAA